VSRRLFQPFVTTKEKGMGLGLTICQSIIEAHTGRIWATKRDGGGAAFHFRLPVSESKGRLRRRIPRADKPAARIEPYPVIAQMSPK
jgi:K+-sensing histidine kinase KdpD